MAEVRNLKLLVWGKWLAVLLGTVAAVGLSSGAALVDQPGGALLHFSLKWLNNAPFKDFRNVGIIIGLVFGLVALINCIGVVLQARWANKLALTEGFILVIAMVLIHFSINVFPLLQLLFLLVGLGICFLAIKNEPKWFH